MTENLTEAFLRRLRHSHVPTEEFYSKDQPRAKDGRWTRGGSSGMSPTGPAWNKGSVSNKIWSGVSAHPVNRTKPVATINISRLTSHDAQALARKIYDADLGDGYSSRCVEIEDSYNEKGLLYVRGYIYKKGREVGSFERTIGSDDPPPLQRVFERSLIPPKPPANPQIVVSHDELVINPSQQGSGLADRFNAHAIAEYQNIGVDRIVTHAGLEVGGFAWARQGFRYDEGGDHEGDKRRRAFLIGRLDALAVRYHAPVVRPHVKQLKRDVAAVRAAIEAGEDVQPIHIAAIGEKYSRYEMRDDHGNTYTTWPGKSSLLGTNWNAVYYFDAAHPVTAAASDLAHADLRPAFRMTVERLVELSFNPHQPRDKEGQWTVSGNHATSTASAPINGKKTYAGTVWVGSYEYSRAITGFSAEAMGIAGFDTSNTQTLYGKNPETGKYDVPEKHTMGEGFQQSAREAAAEMLDAIHKVAPVEKTLWSGQKDDARYRDLKPGDTVELPTTATTSKEAEAHYYPKAGGTVFKFEGGTKGIRIKEASYEIPEWVTAGRFVVSSVTMKTNLVRKPKEGDDTVFTVREVTLKQTHVFDRATSTWVLSEPTNRAVTAALRWTQAPEAD